MTYKNSEGKMVREYRIKISSLCIVMMFISLAEGRQMFKRQIIFPDETFERDMLSCRTTYRTIGRCISLRECQIQLRIRTMDGLSLCDRRRRRRQNVCCPIDLLDRLSTAQRVNFFGPAANITTGENPDFMKPPTPTIGRNLKAPTASDVSRPDFLPADCGISKSPKTRIVNGREAEKGAYPWMALIRREIRRGVKSTECGASLVTNIHVVTAAHCVVDQDTGEVVDHTKLTVRLGEHNIHRDDDGMNPVEIPVESIHTHENFEPVSNKNDIAVLKLAMPVTFTENIQPICLPYNSLKDEDLSGLDAFISGWGSTTFKGPSSDVLMEASIPIVDQNVCRTAYSEMYQIEEEQLCAGTMDGSKDSCQGDSGGPLMLPRTGTRFFLVGIVSVGVSCATPGYPGIYTRVTKYLDWLAKALSN